MRPDDQEPMLVIWAKEECHRLNNRTPPAPCYIGDVLTACHAAHPAEMAKLKTLQLVTTTARDSLEEALQYSSLIATEELTELLKPVVLCPSNIFRCDTRPAKPLDLCLVDLY